MFSVSFVRKCLCVVYLLILFNLTNGSIFDYFPLAKSLFGSSNDENENSNELAMHKVLYEVEVTDEKFIEQAAKFTGVSLSELDKCQHRVVFKLQSECHKLNDEDMAKLAVKLLNCQSAIEGRTIYPCTDEMPIRECTRNMDPDTWNSYLLMSNRARAVCYSIRQAQFRGLTEMTVNKLMGTAHEQLNLMSRLSAGQQRVEAATTEAFERAAVDAAALRLQQQDLQRAQLHGQLALEDNIRRLADEKQLILEGHEQLTIMTKDVQAKLDKAAIQLDEQAEERRDNHRQILNDLIDIQKQAQEIFSHIEESSRHLLSTSTAAAAQYQTTLEQLATINNTISSLGVQVQWLGSTLERHAQWLAEALGGADNTLDRLYLVTSHAAFLLLAMLACAFLQVAPAGRLGLVLLVPTNLALALQHTQALTVPSLALATVAFIVVQSLGSFALQFWHSQQGKATKHPLRPAAASPPSVTHDTLNKTADTFDSPSAHSTVSDSFTYQRGANSTSRYNTYKSFDLDPTDSQSINADFDFASPTPPLSRLSRSRSKTPSVNGLERHRCSATTRMGTPCKSSAMTGRDFCYRHQSGSSVIME